MQGLVASNVVSVDEGRGCITNKNRTGSSYPLSSISQRFVEYSSVVSSPVLDVGVGYGAFCYDIASIEALKEGATVYACDPEAEHLDVLYQKASSIGLLEDLHMLNIPFQEVPSVLPRGSLSAIHISLVLDFFSPQDLLKVMAMSYDLLIPGGLLFSIEYTPYNKSIESFIPLYEKRCKQGCEWPGYVKDISLYCEDCDHLPKAINHFDIPMMKRLLEQHSFEIEMLKYLTDDEAIPPHMRLDGREWVGAIARKPLAEDIAIIQ